MELHTCPAESSFPLLVLRCHLVMPSMCRAETARRPCRKPAAQDAVGPAAIRPAITPGAVGGAGLWHAEAALSRPLGSGALPGQQVTPCPRPWQSEGFAGPAMLVG